MPTPSCDSHQTPTNPKETHGGDSRQIGQTPRSTPYLEGLLERKMAVTMVGRNSRNRGMAMKRDKILGPFLLQTQED
jgi:hypothetical protein